MKNRQAATNIPTILIVFGATGDLMAKMITPALFHLFKKKQLPQMFNVVGFSRPRLSGADFKKHVIKILNEHKDLKVEKTEAQAFLELVSYKNGLFQNKKDYKDLAKVLKKVDDKWGVCSNKLFYLAVPPQYYETIFHNLADSSLTIPCGPGEGWTRVIVEKPFGKDLKTAKKLDELLGELFKEEQIYRIDHYLGKEMLQNILAFRFSNNLFEQSWNNCLIEKIEIRLLESMGADNRGAFYDGVGALRDVGQNHLLQMLALITMDYPKDFKADAIRANRAAILKNLKIPSQEEIKSSSFRAQYKGYQKIKDVVPSSQTETYFKVKTFLTSTRWHGVPIILESGKRMGKAKKEIIITFKHPIPCLCPPGAKEHYKNKLIFHFDPPNEGITIQFWSKKPGLKMEVEERTLDFAFRSSSLKSQYAEEYERLLTDCITGDQTLFVSGKEIKAMWQFIDPIIQAWQKDIVPLEIYQPDSRKITKESRIVEELSHLGKGLIKEIGIIGLGKMGGNMARRLISKKWKVVGFNKEIEATKGLGKEGLIGAYSLKELINKLSSPRIVWLMVPAGKPVDEVIFGKDGLIKYLNKGDIIIDGGNSFYTDSIRRSEKIKKYKINFLDAGVSGGPGGALNGASLMVGGEKKIYDNLKGLFYDLAIDDGYGYMGKAGAGHFVKMVHNGIEYGMMQALAEGFAIMKKSPYKLNLTKIAGVYNHRSVVESRLVGWLKDAYEEFGEELEDISDTVGHTGEGEWTVKVAKKLKVPAPIIKSSFDFRVKSAKNPSYTGKVLSALRNQFGGHKAK